MSKTSKTTAALPAPVAASVAPYIAANALRLAGGKVPTDTAAFSRIARAMNTACKDPKFQAEIRSLPEHGKSHPKWKGYAYATGPAIAAALGCDFRAMEAAAMDAATLADVK